MLYINSDKMYDILSDHADDDVVACIMEEYFGEPGQMARTMSILRMVDIDIEQTPETVIARRPKGIRQHEVVQTFLEIGYALGYVAHKYQE